MTIQRAICAAAATVVLAAALGGCLGADRKEFVVYRGSYFYALDMGRVANGLDNQSIVFVEPGAGRLEFSIGPSFDGSDVADSMVAVEGRTLACRLYAVDGDRDISNSREKELLGPVMDRASGIIFNCTGIWPKNYIHEVAPGSLPNVP